MKKKPKNYDRRERLWNAWSYVADVPGHLWRGFLVGITAPTCLLVGHQTRMYRTRQGGVGFACVRCPRHW